VRRTIYSRIGAGLIKMGFWVFADSREMNKTGGEVSKMGGEGGLKVVETVLKGGAVQIGLLCLA
jgi:hypothetical protein